MQEGYLDRMKEAVFDSGASDHFADEKYDGGAHVPTDDGISVQVADKRIVKSTSN